jgi:hypothetical protein
MDSFFRKFYRLTELWFLQKRRPLPICSFLFVPPKSKEPKEKARRLKLSGRCASRRRRACLNSGFGQALKHADKLLTAVNYDAHCSF